MRKKILKLLYRSLDSPPGKRDSERLDRTLRSDAGLRKLRDDLLAMRRDIAASGTRSFRPGFAGRTLARMRAAVLPGKAEAGFVPVFLALAKRFAVIGAIGIVVFLAYALVNGDLIPRDAVYYISDLSLTRILQFPVF
jgi:hypothetical protein